MVSADDGSVWLVKVTLAVLPSVTGPLFEKVAVGATLVIVSVVAFEVITADAGGDPDPDAGGVGAVAEADGGQGAGRDGRVGAGRVVVLAVAVDVPLVGGADRGSGWSSRRG